jgi:metallopeptidase MepB
MSTDTTPNRIPPQPPIAFGATPSSLVQEAQTLIERSRTVWDGVVSSAAADRANATFDNTIRPIIDDENAKLARTRLLRFFASTSPSKELREASHAATTLLNNSDVELLSRPDVFVLVDAVMRSMNKDPSSALDSDDDDDDDDGQTKYYVHKLHRAMRMNGCAIPDPGIKETFEQANKRVKRANPEMPRELRGGRLRDMAHPGGARWRPARPSRPVAQRRRR